MTKLGFSIGGIFEVNIYLAFGAVYAVALTTSSMAFSVLCERLDLLVSLPPQTCSRLSLTLSTTVAPRTLSGAPDLARWRIRINGLHEGQVR